MQFSWGKFQGTEHFVRDREIFEIEGSRDRESPLYPILLLHMCAIFRCQNNIKICLMENLGYSPAA